MLVKWLVWRVWRIVFTHVLDISAHRDSFLVFLGVLDLESLPTSASFSLKTFTYYPRMHHGRRLGLVSACLRVQCLELFNSFDTCWVNFIFTFTAFFFLVEQLAEEDNVVIPPKVPNINKWDGEDEDEDVKVKQMFKSCIWWDGILILGGVMVQVYNLYPVWNVSTGYRTLQEPIRNQSSGISWDCEAERLSPPSVTKLALHE